MKWLHIVRICIPHKIFLLQKNDEYLTEIDIPKVHKSDKNMLDDFPSYEKCSKDAVNNMKKGKSQGLDVKPGEY